MNLNYSEQWPGDRTTPIKMIYWWGQNKIHHHLKRTANDLHLNLWTYRAGLKLGPTAMRIVYKSQPSRPQAISTSCEQIWTRHTTEVWLATKLFNEAHFLLFNELIRCIFNVFRCILGQCNTGQELIRPFSKPCRQKYHGLCLHIRYWRFPSCYRTWMCNRSSCFMSVIKTPARSWFVKFSSLLASHDCNFFWKLIKFKKIRLGPDVFLCIK